MSRSRIEVPADPRDLPGDFPHQFSVQIRFGDTDAMGHTNNSRFLTFCESSRIDYWEAATGEPFALVTHGAEESLILAEIRVTYRSPSYFGELLTVESRPGPAGAHVVHAGAPGHGLGVAAWPRAARRHGGGRPGPLRLRDGAPAGHPRRAGRAPGGLRGTAAPRLSGGTVHAGLPRRGARLPRANRPGPYASKRRKIVTAFWPPKPKPLIATVSTFALRATSGT